MTMDLNESHVPPSSCDFVACRSLLSSQLNHKRKIPSDFSILRIESNTEQKRRCV